MTYPTAIAYASVAYRTMKYENKDQTEEYFEYHTGDTVRFFKSKRNSENLSGNTLITISDIILKPDE